MKKLCVVVTLSLVLFLSSCAPKSRLIEPKVLEFSNGHLSELVQIADNQSELSYIDGAIENIRLKVRLKLVKESPYLKLISMSEIDMDADDLTIILQDKGGNDLVQMVLQEKEIDNLKSFLTMQEGDETDICFTCMQMDSKAARKVVKKTATLSADEAGDVYPIAYVFEGSIGKHRIEMTIVEISDSEIMGAYYYKRYGPNNLLYLNGERKGDRIYLYEFTVDGMITGTFEGEFSSDMFAGEFSTRDKVYNYAMTPCDDAKMLSPREMDHVYNLILNSVLW